MRFNVNMYKPSGKEIVAPRKHPTTTPFSGIKKEEGESSYKDVKKEDEACESVDGKKKKIKKNGVPEFEITIRKSYLNCPRVFEEDHIPSESMEYTIHHSKRKSSWNVLCLVRENRTVFSSGWSRLARKFPLKVGDRCTFRLIKPTEFILITKKARKESIVVD
ncbi:B3 domain-containing protein [Raphanus sativus]|nr:B3 domain-containing protein [Raphanus sativus]